MVPNIAGAATAKDETVPEAAPKTVSETAADQPETGEGRVVIKKYANRRLYNTRSSSYVTLDHLAEMVKAGTDFVVFDAKTGEEITRSVLAQIIFEEESRTGQNLLPIAFLRQLIRFYGDSMQAMVPSYLEASMDAFTRQQDQFRQQFSKAFTAAPGMAVFEEQARQNMAMFQQAMKMFTPFAYAPGAARPETPAAEPAAPRSAPQDAAELAELKRRMDEMRRQIDKLSGER
jgi:polyhydroxyalkanoate synthesis repressor PhaR